jgi:hypothetical protein
MEVLDKVLSRLVAFREEVVAKDTIVPMWVNDSIEDIEAAQQSVQSDKCPECSRGIVYDAEFDKWFNCSACGGTGIRR